MSKLRMGLRYHLGFFSVLYLFETVHFLYTFLFSIYPFISSLVDFLAMS
jgi:hypothetical protein